MLKSHTGLSDKMSDKFMPCPWCKGKGWIEVGYSLDCMVCEGLCFLSKSSMRVRQYCIFLKLNAHYNAKENPFVLWDEAYFVLKAEIEEYRNALFAFRS
jgi:RecJ-like exonuclease